MKTKENHKRNAFFEMNTFINAMRERGFSALTEMTQSEQVQVVNWAQDVFNQYRNVIDKYPEKIKSSADLPFHKEEIRIAIKTLLPAYLDPASKNTLQELKEKYVNDHEGEYGVKGGMLDCGSKGVGSNPAVRLPPMWMSALMFREPSIRLCNYCRKSNTILQLPC